MELWRLILLHNSTAAKFVGRIAARMLGCKYLRVAIRPTSIPYPKFNVTDALKVPNDESLREMHLRILDYGKVQGSQPLEDDDTDRLTLNEPFQLCKVCPVALPIGGRQNMHHSTLYIGGDLLSLYEAKASGETIFAVVHRSVIDDKQAAIPVLRAVFVRRGDTLGSAASRFPSLGVFPRQNRAWPYAGQVSDMLRDPEMAETGSTTYFRLALTLSCIISQSTTTQLPVHLLAVGDVAQDVDRMMLAAGKTSVRNIFVAPTLQQTLHTALNLTARGVCRILDLNDLVAHQARQSSRLVEFLGEASASACGTLWASVPDFNLKASDQPLDKDLPLISRNGLLRCFALVHRCPTPSSKSIEEVRRRNRPERFDSLFYGRAIDMALRHLEAHQLSASPEATRLLDGFIRVSRKLRNTLVQEVSIHDVGLAFVLARAHAALCLRMGPINTEDALVAIYLCEETFLARTGRSILAFSNALSAGKSNLDLYENLADFGRHVERLLSSHSKREE